MTGTLTEQDLLSQELSNDPNPYFAALRAQDPVHWNAGINGWMLTRYADVSAAFSDPRLSSDRVRPLLEVLSPTRLAEMAPILNTISEWMVVSDPPTHTRLRGLANAAFKQQRVAAMVQWIGEIVDELLDSFIANGGEDFLADVAYPFPATVIARMFGAPAEDRDKFQHWSDELALVAFGAGGDARPDRHERAMAGLSELQDYLRGLIERARIQPGDDMVSVLLADTGDDRLTEDELVGLCSLILFAGHETTTNLLCNGLAALLWHPEQLALLRDEPGRVNTAVEEMLRYNGPIKILTRWVTEDHVRDGKQIRAGERIFLVLGSANRDAQVFPDPDTFDITRPTQPLHVGFGRGMHACLGAQLARLETRVAFPKVLQRLPELRLLDKQVHYKPSVASRAVQSLRIAHEGRS